MDLWAAYGEGAFAGWVVFGGALSAGLWFRGGEGRALGVLCLCVGLWLWLLGGWWGCGALGLGLAGLSWSVGVWRGVGGVGVVGKVLWLSGGALSVLTAGLSLGGVDGAAMWSCGAAIFLVWASGFLRTLGRGEATTLVGYGALGLGGFAWGFLGEWGVGGEWEWAGWLGRGATASGLGALLLASLTTGRRGVWERAMAAAREGVWEWDAGLDKVWTSQWVRRESGIRSGVSREEWLKRIHPLDRGGWDRVFWNVGAGMGEWGDFRQEFRLLGADGEYRWWELRGRLGGGRCVATASRVDGRKRNEEELKERALRDGLTGLSGRALFLERVDWALARGVEGGWLGLMCVDRLREINEGMGQAAGDALLVSLARRLEEAVKGSGGVEAGRLGGDVFGFLGGEGLDAEGLKDLLERPLKLGGREVYPSLSVGTAARPLTGLDAEGALARAERAMNEAKRGGGGRYETVREGFSDGFDALGMEEALRGALEGGELRAAYQPIVRLLDGKVAGFEALARWEGASTEEFLQVARRTGLIHELGRGVMEAAMKELGRWRTVWRHDPPLFVTMNLSREELYREGLCDDVKRALSQASWVEPSGLCVEISESVAMDDPERTIGILESLRGLGVRVAMDDFGSGHASFGHWRRFKFDMVKVDRALVEGETFTSHGRAILRAIGSLAQDFDLEVVVEGVDDERKAGALRDLGCRYGQGYYFSRPLESDAVASYVSRNRPRLYLYLCGDLCGEMRIRDENAKSYWDYMWSACDGRLGIGSARGGGVSA